MNTFIKGRKEWNMYKVKEEDLKQKKEKGGKQQKPQEISAS